MPKALWNSAWALLILGNIFWSMNVVLGRAVVGHVPPITLAYLRWTGAFLVAIGFAWPYVKKDWPVLLQHWKLLVLLAATGIATFNTAAYLGLTSTTALNVLLMQSALPLIIIAWAFALFGERPTPRQAIAIVISLAGVGIIATRGSLQALLTLRLNRGDAWILGASVIYGIYCTLLRRRPTVHPLSFLIAIMGLGSCMMLPFYVMEVSGGATIQGGWPSYLAVAYTAVFPSFISYLLFNRGVELIGAARAGQSMHLMPLFGSILAVVFLGEAFQLYHAGGIVLIATGILLASIRVAAPQPAR